MRFLVAALAVLSALAGCGALPHRTVGNEPCRLSTPDPRGHGAWETADGLCKDKWAVRAATHGVNYVEIDPQGVLHNREAVEDALAFAGAPTTHGRPAYVVVFIHGWHHNAAPGDINVQAFHSALAALKTWHPNDDVRGIYVGWRGASFDVPVLRYLTFWDRKDTSNEVGRGGLLEFLLRLERAVKPSNDSPNRLVLVGHSFGASVAFNSLAHVFMERFIEGLHSDSRQSRFRGYGDLVVLINPAIEAMRYMPLQSAVEYYSKPNRAGVPRLSFDGEDNPRLVILSSLGDWATRKTFPVARFINTIFEEHQKVSSRRSPDDNASDADSFSEWVMDSNTIANFDRFQTHWPIRIVESAPSPDPTAQIKGLAEDEKGRCRIPPREEMWRLLAQPLRSPPELPDEFQDSHFRLASKSSTIRRSPYVVADVGAEIIADHTSIDSLNLICWINQLVDAR